jgi:hypothetical protein
MITHLVRVVEIEYIICSSKNSYFPLTRAVSGLYLYSAAAS